MTPSWQGDASCSLPGEVVEANSQGKRGRKGHRIWTPQRLRAAGPRQDQLFAHSGTARWAQQSGFAQPLNCSDESRGCLCHRLPQ